MHHTEILIGTLILPLTPSEPYYCSHLLYLQLTSNWKWAAPMMLFLFKASCRALLCFNENYVFWLKASLLCITWWFVLQQHVKSWCIKSGYVRQVQTSRSSGEKGRSVALFFVLKFSLSVWIQAESDVSQLSTKFLLTRPLVSTRPSSSVCLSSLLPCCQFARIVQLNFFHFSFISMQNS